MLLKFSVDFCPAEDTALDRTGRHHWPRTLAGVEVFLDCPYGNRKNSPNAFATRKCEADSNGKFQWQSPDTKDCVEVHYLEFDRKK